MSDYLHKDAVQQEARITSAATWWEQNQLTVCDNDSQFAIESDDNNGEDTHNA